ncbi:hypothetical protein T01_13388 [Trichinella spiralis]|uniref:Uncharacterized protein n=1 Tax=Trichinella spiralis TaxID=6334 RepID=A0A0V0Z3X6_TRISP|nr:hypothetical protein T01_13388 [Trichinella spiralis]
MIPFFLYGSIPQYPCLSRLLEVDLCAIHIPKRFLISQCSNPAV